MSKNYKIRVLCVIGHGLNLIPHYIKHYNEFNVDEINFVIYENDNNFSNKVKKIIENCDSDAPIHLLETINYRKYDWYKVTDLYNKHKLKHPNDWWIIADIDEFHKYPKDLNFICENADNNGYSIIRGGFIDRISSTGEFVMIENDKTLWDTFDLGGYYRNPLCGADMNKITLVKGWVKITYGQHYVLLGGSTNWRWQGWNHPLIYPYNEIFVEVHHFKWDSTVLERIKDVSLEKHTNSFYEEYDELYKNISKNDFKIDINDPNFSFLLLNNKSYQETNKIQFNHLRNRIITI